MHGRAFPLINLQFATGPFVAQYRDHSIART